MTTFRSLNFRNAIILILTTILVMVFFGKVPYTIEPFSNLDLKYYMGIAEAAPGLDPDMRQPFAFRLFGPYLVGLLPISEPLGFHILTIVSAFCLVFLYYYLLRYIGLSPFVALISVILVNLNRYVFGWTSWNFFMVNDFLAMIFIIIMFLAMWKSQWTIFAIALAFGAMTRETAMLLVPVALFYIWERKELPLKWRKVLLACIPGLVTILLIRLFVPIGEGRSLTEALATHSSKLLEPSSLFRLLVNTFLPFTLIPLVYFETTINFFRSQKYLLFFVVLVFGTTLFGSNQERLMAPTFIVFFMLLGTILESVHEKKMTFFVLLAAGFLSSFHYGFGIWQVPNADWTRALTLGSALFVTLYMVFLKRRAQARLLERDKDKNVASTNTVTGK